MGNRKEEKAAAFDRQEVLDRLISQADSAYQEFHSGLVPGIGKLIGVRTPALRKIGREIGKGSWRDYISQVRDAWQKGDIFYEERILWGMAIGYASLPWAEKLEEIRAFVPVIDNWAVCDLFCGTLKEAGRHRQETWEFLKPYLESEEEYENRFGAVMLLSHFVEEEYAGPALKAMESLKSQGYYCKMAAAWAVSVFFVKLPDQVRPFLEQNEMDDWIHNKAIQKICESYRVDKETKEELKKLKRKGAKRAATEAGA